MSWQFIPPTQPPKDVPPPVSADEYPLGTRAVDEKGNTWRVDWDNQDHRHMWVKDESADEYPIGTRAVDALGNTWKVWIDNRNGHVWVKDEEAI